MSLDNLIGPTVMALIAGAGVIFQYGQNAAFIKNADDRAKSLALSLEQYKEQNRRMLDEHKEQNRRDIDDLKHESGAVREGLHEVQRDVYYLKGRVNGKTASEVRPV